MPTTDFQRMHDRPPGAIDLKALAAAVNTAGHVAQTKRRSWGRLARSCATKTAIAVYLLLLALGAVMTMAVVARMLPTLTAADAAIAKIDTIYETWGDIVAVACGTPDAVPPSLRPLLCGGQR